MKNLIKYIEKQQSAIYKSFSLFAKENGKGCGIIMVKINYQAVDKPAYAMPAVPKELAAKPAPVVAAASPAKPEEAKPEEALLEDHAVAEVDDSHDHVHYAEAVSSGPPLVLIAGGAVALLAVAALALGGGKKAAPPPPPPPPPPKGGKKK